MHFKCSIFRAAALSIISLLFLAHTNVANAQTGYSTNPNGLKYRFHKSNKETPKAKVGDFLALHMIYLINGEEVFYDSHINPEPMQLELQEPGYPGDINEGLAMMHKNDSASFILDAVEFFTKTVNVQELPQPFKAGDKLHLDVTILEVIDRDQYIAQQQRMIMEKQQQAENEKVKEKSLIETYLKEKSYNPQVLPSGLMILHITEGTGELPKPGSKLSVHYRGTTLDGEVFDESYARGQPIQFKLGANQVIRGWDEGLGYVKKGGKAILIIPFELAYGERQAGSIPSYSTLVFEVEMVDFE